MIELIYDTEEEAILLREFQKEILKDNKTGTHVMIAKRM